MVGAFAEKGKHVFLDGKPPMSEYISLPEDWEQFGKKMKGIFTDV